METQPSQNLDSIWLTQTKFLSPRLRDDIVQRPRLLNAWHGTVPSHAPTLVSAPAGYGTTTLFTSRATSFPDIGIAWIPLDEDDNASTRFLAAMISALQQTNPV